MTRKLKVPPFAGPQTMSELLFLALEGLLPATPDLAAYFDRLEGRA